MKGWGTIVACATFIGASAVLSGPIARAQSCESLWAERNTYYKQAGYCFKTPRAIAYFGNAGCLYDDLASVPLSWNVRRRINQIVAMEEAMGCN